MLNRRRKNYFHFIGYTSAIALSVLMPLSVQAVPQSGNVLNRLLPQEQATLKAGNAVVTGENGHYVGRILITAPVSITWNVLTDYDHFKNFLPGVISSQILETQGNRTVFEQVNQVKVLLFTQKSRLVITAVQQYPQEISFQLKQGEIKSLKGLWKLEPVAPNQVLVTQDVTFDPGNSISRGLAFTIYKNALVDSLNAIKQEVGRRVTNSKT
ncbi:SRPBCC family protein (plasmid) [Kovacikia minuta CCNUW1]|uniref:SRPBCC family protein n=1 Tax=Kovacikia minuta TaxID=2931930 RepID=UPI001CCFA9AF|nr:SRPBCC family protein [Kovacikia minuta]UBF29795.1 SRPBCC family protein [Kovacikia minuta CCNUW1]